MNLSWTSEQRELFDSVERFASDSLCTGIIERDRAGEFNREGWQACSLFGIPGLPVPREYGGRGLDAVTTVGALERLGRACGDNGLMFGINAQMWTVEMPLMEFGTNEQRVKYLPKLCNGVYIGANAVSESGSGSDAYSMSTVAERRGDRYILNGSKMYVTNGPVADVVVTFATVDHKKGAGGITAFVVDASSPGVSVVRTVEKMGLRTAQMGELRFDGCEVPVTDRLGAEGNGAALFTHSMSWERGCILATAVGRMSHLLARCVRYSKQRQQFGQPIGTFQQVASRLVDMRIRLETSRALLYRYAWERSRGKSALLEASMAKMHISECWVKCCEDAIQVHGGLGYLTECELERELRDAIASRIFSGTNEIQRNIIASLL